MFGVLTSYPRLIYTWFLFNSIHLKKKKLIGVTWYHKFNVYGDSVKGIYDKTNACIHLQQRGEGN